MTRSKALPASPKIAFPAGTKAGSEVTLVTATPAQSRLTESLRHSCRTRARSRLAQRPSPGEAKPMYAS
jgi:hypothetical protein